MTHPIIKQVMRTGYPYKEKAEKFFAECAHCGEELYNSSYPKVRNNAGEYFCSALCLCRHHETDKIF